MKALEALTKINPLLAEISNECVWYSIQSVGSDNNELADQVLKMIQSKINEISELRVQIGDNFYKKNNGNGSL